MSWTISIPILLALFAAIVFIYAANCDRDDSALCVIAELILSASVYFYIYGLCTALGV